MNSTDITIVIPPVVLDEGMMVLVVGDPAVEIGDEVKLIDLATPAVTEGLFVEDIDAHPLNEMPQELLDQFWLLGLEEAKRALTLAYKTGFGIDVPLTVYTLSLTPLFEDYPFGEVSDDDIVEDEILGIVDEVAEWEDQPSEWRPEENNDDEEWKR